MVMVLTSFNKTNVYTFLFLCNMIFVMICCCGGGNYDILIDTDYVVVKTHQGKNNKINIINLNNNKDIYLFYIFAIRLIFK